MSRATSQSALLETFSLDPTSSSFLICVNLLHSSYPSVFHNGLLLAFKEALSTTVLCALLFLFFPRVQFIARLIVGRPAFASQAVFYDKADASAREILM